MINIQDSINKLKVNNDDYFPSINNSIKKSFISDDELEAFKKRGGSIQVVPFGQRSAKPSSDLSYLSINEKAAKRKAEHPPTPQPIKENTEKSLKKTRPVKTLSPKDVAAAILKSRVKKTTEEKTVSTPDNNLKSNPRPKPAERTIPRPTPKPKIKKPRKPRSKNPASPDELQRLKEIQVNRSAAVAANQTSHIGRCRIHGYTEYTIFHENRRSSCKICRSTRFTANGRVEPDAKETKRLADLREAKSKAIANNETTFTAVCRVHGVSTYMIQGSASRCVECRENVKRKNRGGKDAPSNESNCERLERNHKAYELAKAKGLNLFIGECNFHEIAPFTTEQRKRGEATHESYRCIECRKISQYNSRINKKATTQKKV